MHVLIAVEHEVTEHRMRDECAEAREERTVVEHAHGCVLLQFLLRRQLGTRKFVTAAPHALLVLLCVLAIVRRTTGWAVIIVFIRAAIQDVLLWTTVYLCTHAHRTAA